VLTGIRLGRSVGECGYELAPNAERHLRSRLRLANLYPAGALEETVRIARRCRFSLDELRYEYPDELVPAGYTPASYLREQTYIGAHGRFPNGIPFNVQAQIEHELQLIAELKYEPYFLTVYDIVRFARSQNILCQGRGSAANSAVCYCLRVTEVDPARGNMLFERFISKERNEPPDIDVYGTLSSTDPATKRGIPRRVRLSWSARFGSYTDFIGIARQPTANLRSASRWPFYRWGILQ
jgi:error-prone DNA polymerase